MPDTIKKQTLLNKNIEILDFLYDTETHSITSIEEKKNPEYAPIQILDGKNGISRKKLNEWWGNRSIPNSRENITSKLYDLGLVNTVELLERCFGLSLSDQYWVKDYGSTLQWKDINFFDNEFSEDIGNYLFGNANICNNMISPDNSSDGILQKKWKIINGDRYLIKSGSNVYNQEPFNEIVATELYSRLLNPEEYVKYELYQENGKFYSMCKDMINTSTELVPAYAVSGTQKLKGNDSLYNQYIYCCNEFGIADAQNKIDKMIVCDYIMSNIDRHWNNFGIIRNIDTLVFTGIAPIFDNGSSLGAKLNTKEIFTSAHALEKNNPFKKNFDSQLSLVKDLSWLNPDSLHGFAEKAIEILKQNPYIDETRLDAIKSVISGNLYRLLQYQKEIQSNLSWKEKAIAEMEKQNSGIRPTNGTGIK